jgi:hypothetical protein
MKFCSACNERSHVTNGLNRSRRFVLVNLQVCGFLSHNLHCSRSSDLATATMNANNNGAHTDQSVSEDLGRQPSDSGDSPLTSVARDDTPEALVRRENRAIQCVKLFAILVLLGAALTTAGMIFQYTQGSEKSSFHNDFALISEAITESLLQDAGNVFSSVQAVATTMMILMEAYNQSQLGFTVPLPRYKALTAELAKTSYFVTFNPILRSDEERRQFEAMVIDREEEGFFDTLFHSPCYVCGGDEGMSPSTPMTMVSFPGAVQVSCGGLDYAGRNGLLEEAGCPYISSRVAAECSCSLSDAYEHARDTRSPSAGIFRLANDTNLTLQDEPWNGGPYMPMLLDALMISDRRPMLYNQLSSPTLARAASQMMFTGIPQMTEMLGHGDPTYYSKLQKDPRSGPSSILYFPVQSPNGTEMAGALSVPLIWSDLLRRPVPRNGKLATIVIDSSCGQTHTYRVKSTGTQLDWVGEGDLHDRQYDDMVGQTSFDDFAFFRLAYVGRDPNTTREGSCDYRFSGKKRQIKICQIKPNIDVSFLSLTLLSLSLKTYG